MDLATDYVCDMQCKDCTNKAAQLCRRWVPQFEAREPYVLELEEDNRRLRERADACWQLAWDCMSYIASMRDERLIGKKAFEKLRERADRLGVYEKE